jgi:hypothetical protein
LEILVRILLPFVPERVSLLRVIFAAVRFGEYGLLADPASLLFGNGHLFSLELVYLRGRDDFSAQCLGYGFLVSVCI